MWRTASAASTHQRACKLGCVPSQLLHHAKAHETVLTRRWAQHLRQRWAGSRRSKPRLLLSQSSTPNQMHQLRQSIRRLRLPRGNTPLSRGVVSPHLPRMVSPRMVSLCTANTRREQATSRRRSRFPATRSGRRWSRLWRDKSLWGASRALSFTVLWTSNLVLDEFSAALLPAKRSTSPRLGNNTTTAHHACNAQVSSYCAV